MPSRKHKKIQRELESVLRGSPRRSYWLPLLELLTERQREVITVLCALDDTGMGDYEAVAEVLHIDSAQVRKVVRAARRRLRHPSRLGTAVRHLDRLPTLDTEGSQEEQGNRIGIIAIDAPIIVHSGCVARHLLERFSGSPQQLHDLGSREFEILIAEVWKRFGYEVELTSSTRDGGRDIVAVKHGFVSVRYLIECKRYARESKVDVRPVRELYGIKQDEGATKAILAATCGFTRGALAFFERHHWELEGRDYDGVVEWLRLADSGVS